MTVAHLSTLRDDQQVQRVNNALSASGYECDPALALAKLYVACAVLHIVPSNALTVALRCAFVCGCSSATYKRASNPTHKAKDRERVKQNKRRDKMLRNIQSDLDPDVWLCARISIAVTLACVAITHSCVPPH